MISLPLAQQLKENGLEWHYQVYDRFAVPVEGLQDQSFILADIPATVESVQGWPVIMFHGASEWALDYIVMQEVVWLPTENQLRELIEDAILGEETLHLQLILQHDGYRCEMIFQKQKQIFKAKTASDAYGLALLHILQTESQEVH